MSNEFHALKTRIQKNIERLTNTLDGLKAQLAAVERMINDSEKPAKK